MSLSWRTAPPPRVVIVLFLAAALASPAGAQVQIADSLLVDLDAKDASAGEPVWANVAPDAFGDFVEVGDPFVEEIDGITAVTFNSTDVQDAYQSEVDAPDGLIGLDPTRSIEAWVYNAAIPDEETIVAWGHRGGPDGTNMSFNYGTNPFFGAIGHWGGAGPDIGWNNAGGAPAPGRFHHLAYTYDGNTTRVYADGCVVDTNDCETNTEVLGAGVINTYGPSKITLAAQLEADGITLNVPLRGTLSIAKLRIHDGVLTPEQIQKNYDLECPTYCPKPGSCTCDNCPQGDDSHFRGKAVYRRALKFGGFPAPTGFAALEPAGATMSPTGVLSYTLPNPAPASFNVRVQCTNTEGSATFAWRVTLVDPVARSPLEKAGELFVDLDARDASAGETSWLNLGTLADFARVGNPVAATFGPEDSAGVSFNSDVTQDAYQCGENAPASLCGLNPTRTIEVWAYNPDIANEETLVAWSYRGGPAGTNMSFNYGTNQFFGAVGHWDSPDIGWDNLGGAPDPAAWHHLVYTYDGDQSQPATRVYADGIRKNWEKLAPGVINTYEGTPITLAAQLDNAGGALNFAGIQGSLALAAVRVHDGVLTPAQIYKNFLADSARFGATEPDADPPVFQNVPDNQTFCDGQSSYAYLLDVTGVPPPALEVVQPAGATITANGLLTYAIPNPAPSSFTVEVKATSTSGTVSASWTVTRLGVGGGISIAEELIVDLDARDPTAGTDLWANAGTLGDFQKRGAPVVIKRNGVACVSFNEDGRSGDTYQSIEIAPPGLVGIDPTRTIEVWAYNPGTLTDEETLVSWAHRNGPAGTNMSFNYGTNQNYGAVGHWDAPDIGWGSIPPADQWHHLVYTYDGTTTRVYSDGVMTNSEVLGPGVINTYDGSPITLAVQIFDASVDPDNLDFGGRMGVLEIAKVRVHDGVLSDCEVQGNYIAEKDTYNVPCPQAGNPDFADTHVTSLVVESITNPLNSHRATATAVDDTGDPIFYTFVATDGTRTRTIGPTKNNVAVFNLKGAAKVTVTVTADDRSDCDDAAADGTKTATFPSDVEICDNGTDDDGDSNIDCADSDCTGTPSCTGSTFHRGDADDNGELQLTDAIRILGFLFLGAAAPTCLDAADADGNNDLQLTDAIRVLGYLFLGGPPPESPGPPPDACGPDPDAVHLGCESYTHC